MEQFSSIIKNINMIVLPDTKAFDSSIRLVQLVGGVTKANMLKVCDKLDLYVTELEEGRDGTPSSAGIAQ